jgi:hypothetical protein
MPPLRLNGIFVFSQIMAYTKYKADAGWKDITPVEITRETESTVWLTNGHRAQKKGPDYDYFDTHEEAVQFVLAAFQKNINDAKQAVIYHEVQLTKFTHKYGIENGK